MKYSTKYAFNVYIQINIMVENETTEKILENTEVYNWALKFIQCSTNIFEFFSRTMLNQNIYSNFAFKIAQARKIFRLFKFLNEIPRIYYLIDSNCSTFSKNLNFIARLFTCIFYFLENITLFQNLKLLNDNTLLHIELIMSLSFLLAQTFQSLYYFYIIRKTYNDEESLKQDFQSQIKLRELCLKLSKLSKIRGKIIYSLIKCLGDFCLACYDLKIFENVISGKLAKFLLSITGLCSSVVALNQLSSN